jgi:3-deoxy-D-arabino-heptulosonate 7-phosphate (DAHP) synthase
MPEILILSIIKQTWQVISKIAMDVKNIHEIIYFTTDYIQFHVGVCSCHDKTKCLSISETWYGGGT